MSGQIVDASLRRVSAIRTTRRTRLKMSEHQQIGGPSRLSCGVRIPTRAGQSNSPRPSRARMAQCRRSIWRARYFAIRTVSRSIAVSASSADGWPQIRLSISAVVWAKDCSTRAIGERGGGQYRLPMAAKETLLNENAFHGHIRSKPINRARVEHVFASTRIGWGYSSGPLKVLFSSDLSEQP